MEEILGSDIWVMRSLLSRDSNVLRPVYTRENTSRPHLSHPELTSEVNSSHCLPGTCCGDFTSLGNPGLSVEVKKVSVL